MTDDKWTKIANDIADGKDVDWDNHDKLTAEEKQWLEQLNSLEKISKVFDTQNDSDKNKGHEYSQEYLFSWGHLQVVEKIGEGSFGEVYKAYDPILDRDVALKLFKNDGYLSLQSRHLIQEAKRLAKVRNEHVLAVHGANVYDERAGMWSDLVIGKNLSNNNYSHKLKLKPLMELMSSMADALKVVHKADLIHGDIKPSNIMQQQDGKYILMDFGAGTNRDKKQLDSQPGSGTPLFMAPELFADKNISRATDIYAFGVLLFKLATTVYPINCKNLSDVYQAHKDKKYKSIDALRSDLPKSLRQLINKMMSVNPESRPSAEQILKKYNWIVNAPQRRNKRMIVSLIITLLFCGIVISSVGFYRAKKAQIIAVNEKDKAQAVNEFLQNMLSSAAHFGKGRDIKVADILDIASIDIKNKFDKQPHIKAATHDALGNSYGYLNMVEKSIEHFEQSLKFKQDLNDLDSLETLKTTIELATSYLSVGEIKKSQSLTQKVITIASKEPEKNFGIIQLANIRLASSFLKLSDFKKAEKMYSSSVEELSKSEKEYPLYEFLALSGLTSCYINQSEYKKAELTVNKALLKLKTMPHYSVTNYLLIKNIQAHIFSKMGNLEQAEIIFFNILKIIKTNFGAENNSYLLSTINLGAILQEQGKLADALKYQQLAYDLSNKIRSENHLTKVAMGMNLANTKVSLGLLDQGEDLMRKTLKTSISHLGESHIETLKLEYNLAELLNKQGKYTEAEELARKNNTKMQLALGETHLFTLLSQDNIAVSLTGQKRYEHAEELLNQTIELIKSTVGDKSPYMILVQEHLIQMLIESNQNSKAIEQLELLINLQEQLLGPNHQDTMESKQKLQNFSK